MKKIERLAEELIVLIDDIPKGQANESLLHQIRESVKDFSENMEKYFVSKDTLMKTTFRLTRIFQEDLSLIDTRFGKKYGNLLIELNRCVEEFGNNSDN